MKNKEVENHWGEMQEKLNKMLSKNGLMKENYRIIAVGYLSPDEEFEKGEVSVNFLTKLKVLWNEGITLATAGHHTCEFCNIVIGSSEKVLIDNENKVKYIFPELIFHYITHHNFKPCKEFIEFVMKN